jgi:hypothetical protein
MVTGTETASQTRQNWQLCGAPPRQARLLQGAPTGHRSGRWRGRTVGTFGYGLWAAGVRYWVEVRHALAGGCPGGLQFAAGTGVWVNVFRGELRTRWFPAPAARRLAGVGAPAWAVEIFDCLRAANGGTLSGFLDVFAWREPGRAAFFEVKAGPDRIKPTQLRFTKIALRPAGHRIS